MQSFLSTILPELVTAAISILFFGVASLWAARIRSFKFPESAGNAGGRDGDKILLKMQLRREVDNYLHIVHRTLHKAWRIPQGHDPDEAMASELQSRRIELDQATDDIIQTLNSRLKVIEKAQEVMTALVTARGRENASLYYVVHWMESQERKKKRRDYALWLAAIVATMVVSVLIEVGKYYLFGGEVH